MTGYSCDVSVVVVSRGGASTIGRTLRSLARQSLSASRFEVVVVQHGVADATVGVLAQLRNAYPELQLRHVTCTAPGSGRARNVGLRCARGRFVMFVDDQDELSESNLAALLACSREATVAVALVANLPSLGQAPDFRTPTIARQLALAGRVIEPSECLPEIWPPTGKMMPTAVARAIEFDSRLDGGEGVLFFEQIMTRTALTFTTCPLADHAVYFRQPRPQSARRCDDSFDLCVSNRLAVLGERRHGAATTALAQAAGQELLDNQTALLNRYLRLHPDDHAATVRAITERGIADIQFEILNAGVARDLALLYASLPYADTSANVAARRIRKEELLRDVISVDLGKHRGLDPSAVAIWRPYLDELVTLPGPATMEGHWPYIAKFCHNGIAEVAARQERKKQRYRSVYSRAMFPASHILAAFLKARQPDIIWRAEFSDPQLRDIRGIDRKSSGEPDAELIAELQDVVNARGFDITLSDNVWNLAEQIAYALADTILFTNENQRSYMLTYAADVALRDRAAEVSDIERHPVPPAELYHATDPAYQLDPARVHIGYFGRFYLTRGLTEVLDALVDMTPAERERIQLHLFVPDPSKMSSDIMARGLGDTVVVNAYVDFLDFLNLTTRFDVLLVNDARTAQAHGVNPYLPSKYADYLGSGRQIWGIVEPGSMLDKSQLDHRCGLGDVRGAHAVLTALSEERDSAHSISAVSM